MNDLAIIYHLRYPKDQQYANVEEVDKWHVLIGDPFLGDAILDRLVHNAYRIELESESMRRRSMKLTAKSTSD